MKEAETPNQEHPRRPPPSLPVDIYHYLPADDDLLSWDIYLTGCGRCTSRKNTPYPPAGHPSLYNFEWREGRVLPEFQILLITDGAGKFCSRPRATIPVKHGDILFLFPGIWHSYRPLKGSGWTERWISINGDLVHRLQDRGVISPDVPVQTAHHPDRLAAQFDALVRDVHTHPSQNSIALSLQAMGLVGAVVNACRVTGLAAPTPSARRGIRDALVAHVVDAIWSHSHRQLTVDDLIAPLSAARRTVERRFRKEIGHSIHDEIARCRLRRAKRLLRETHLPVKMVTYLSGFSSEERMRVTFQKQERCSPQAYRVG